MTTVLATITLFIFSAVITGAGQHVMMTVMVSRMPMIINCHVAEQAILRWRAESSLMRLNGSMMMVGLCRIEVTYSP